MKISIIIATYNCVESIEQAISSVLAQNNPELEMILIDGGSRDGTVDVIKKYSDKISYWVSEKDGGIYAAWNKGIVKAKGDYIAFIGGDDVITKDYAIKYIDYIERFPGVDFISSKMFVGSLNGVVFGEQWSFCKFKNKMNVVHPGSLHNRKLFDRYGLYDEDLKIVGDYEFLLRVGPSLNSGFINSPTVIFGLNGISSNRVIALAKEVRISKLKNKTKNRFEIEFEYLVRLLLGVMIVIKRLLIGKTNRT